MASRLTGLALLFSASGANAQTLAWQYLGIDCPGNDVSSSPAAQPEQTRCDASMAGIAAVSWDGTKQRHHSFANAACTYKSVRSENCSGGRNPAFIYRCE